MNWLLLSKIYIYDQSICMEIYHRVAASFIFFHLSLFFFCFLFFFPPPPLFFFFFYLFLLGRGREVAGQCIFGSG